MQQGPAAAAGWLAKQAESFFPAWEQPGSMVLPGAAPTRPPARSRTARAAHAALQT